MFTLLSNQKKILSLLNESSKQSIDSVYKNMATIIKLLSTDIDQLLNNKQNLGVLIPQDNQKTLPITHNEIANLDLAQLMTEPYNLVSAINTLCLTEAIIVRDNFSNCIEIAEELTNKANKPVVEITVQPKPQPKAKAETETETETSRINSTKAQSFDKNNVSPIRLTQIKQRLAEAAQANLEKQNAIKNRLNKLLDKQEKSLPKKNTKRA